MSDTLLVCRRLGGSLNSSVINSALEVLAAAVDKLKCVGHLLDSSMSQRQYNSFTEFWPHYVAEHSQPATRMLHLVGTTIALGCVVYFIAFGKWWLFPLALVPGYGAAWIGHFFIEKNKPATFQYPLWSFMGDYKMIWMMLTGRMDGEVAMAKKSAGASPPS